MDSKQTFVGQWLLSTYKELLNAVANTKGR